MKWKKGTVQIIVNLPKHVGQIERTVDAYISGPFAIHRPMYENRTWILSHVPTGSKIVGSRTMRDAKIAAERFAIFPVDWNDKDLRATRDLYEFARSLRREGYVL